MDDEKIKLIFQLAGGILGIIAFFWNLVGFLWTYVFSHLQIDISNEKIILNNEEKLKVTVMVENKGNIAKKIDFAFLLIKPDKESFKNALLQIANHNGFQGEHIEITNLLQHLVEKREQLSSKIIDNCFAIHTLPYYYDEQFQIGNEKVKYSCILDLTGLQKNSVYNIRFVTISKHLFKIYLRYRSTSDLFIC